MSDHMHYVPILRWKAGEKGALKGLYQNDKEGITPLIEWSRPGEVSPQEDRETPTPSPSDFALDILKHWGPRSFFCDLRWFSDNNLGGDLRALRSYAQELATTGTRAIPVIGLEDGVDFKRVLSPLIAQQGLCLRVKYSELTQRDLATRIGDFLSTVNLSWSKVDIVFDFETHCREINIAALCSLSPIGACRTFTVAAGSFPMDLRGFKGPQTFYLPREEWVQWLDQIEKSLLRRPSFGDYATLHPVLTTSQYGLNPSATIRYTTEDYWLVMKGEGLHNEGGPGYAQYKANAMLLMRRPDFSGPDFSAGDEYIVEVARDHTSFGNPTTWIRAGVNHHVTLVVRQVANVARVGARGERLRAQSKRPDRWTKMWDPPESTE